MAHCSECAPCAELRATLRTHNHNHNHITRECCCFASFRPLTFSQPAGNHGRSAWPACLPISVAAYLCHQLSPAGLTECTIFIPVERERAPNLSYSTTCRHPRSFVAYLGASLSSVTARSEDIVSGSRETHFLWQQLQNVSGYILTENVSVLCGLGYSGNRIKDAISFAIRRLSGSVSI